MGCEVKSDVKDNLCVIGLSGRVDSANAEAVEKEIGEAIEQAGKDGLIIDAEELEYISSAGLRVILRLKKKFKDLKVINTSTDVYEIFEMTGFSEIMEVQKAYRKVSIEGCEMLGEGSNGIVYRIDPDTVVKVYKKPDCLPEIEHERKVARKAFVLGIPTAISYDIAQVGDSFGSVFELLNAKSFSKLLAADESNFDNCVEQYVKLMKLMHETEVEEGELPAMRETALGWARFVAEHIPEDQGKKLVSMFEAIPEDLHLVHGDYHTKNIMLQNGEVLLIDMDTLSTGHPIYEIGQMFLSYEGFGALDKEVITKFMGYPYELAHKFWKESLRQYFDGADQAFLDDIEAKAEIVGYTRLMRRTIRRGGGTEEALKLIDYCRERLADSLAKVDSLTW